MTGMAEENEKLKARAQQLEAENAGMRDALLNADRYFKAKDGVYFCDVGLCETAAKYAVDRILSSTPPNRVDALVEVLEEVAMDPYADSDLGSLLKTLQARARQALEDFRK